MPEAKSNLSRLVDADVEQITAVFRDDDE